MVGRIVVLLGVLLMSNGVRAAEAGKGNDELELGGECVVSALLGSPAWCVGARLQIMAW